MPTRYRSLANTILTALQTRDALQQRRRQQEIEDESRERNRALFDTQLEGQRIANAIREIQYQDLLRQMTEPEPAPRLFTEREYFGRDVEGLDFGPEARFTGEDWQRYYGFLPEPTESPPPRQSVGQVLLDLGAPQESVPQPLFGPFYEYEDPDKARQAALSLAEQYGITLPGRRAEGEPEVMWTDWMLRLHPIEDVRNLADAAAQHGPLPNWLVEMVVEGAKTSTDISNVRSQIGQRDLDAQIKLLQMSGSFQPQEAVRELLQQAGEDIDVSLFVEPEGSPFAGLVNMSRLNQWRSNLPEREVLWTPDRLRTHPMPEVQKLVAVAEASPEGGIPDQWVRDVIAGVKTAAEVEAELALAFERHAQAQKVLEDLNRLSEPYVTQDYARSLMQTFDPDFDITPYVERSGRYAGLVNIDLLRERLAGLAGTRKIVAQAQAEEAENRPIGESVANALGVLGIEIPPTATPAELKSVFGNELVQQLINFAKAPDELERIRLENRIRELDLETVELPLKTGGRMLVRSSQVPASIIGQPEQEQVWTRTMLEAHPQTSVRELGPLADSFPGGVIPDWYVKRVEEGEMTAADVGAQLALMEERRAQARAAERAAEPVYITPGGYALTIQEAIDGGFLRPYESLYTYRVPTEYAAATGSPALLVFKDPNDVRAMAQTVADWYERNRPEEHIDVRELKAYEGVTDDQIEEWRERYGRRIESNYGLGPTYIRTYEIPVSTYARLEGTLISAGRERRAEQEARAAAQPPPTITPAEIFQLAGVPVPDGTIVQVLSREIPVRDITDLFDAITDIQDAYRLSQNAAGGMTPAELLTHAVTTYNRIYAAGEGSGLRINPDGTVTFGGGIRDDAPPFDQWFRTEYRTYLDTADAILRGESVEPPPPPPFDAEEEARRLIQAYGGKAEALQVLENYRELVKQQGGYTDEEIDQVIEAVMLTPGESQTQRRGFPAFLRSIGEYLVRRGGPGAIPVPPNTQTPPAQAPSPSSTAPAPTTQSAQSSDRFPQVGSAQEAANHVIAIFDNDPVEAADALRRATPEERRAFESYYGVAFDYLLRTIEQRGGR